MNIDLSQETQELIRQQAKIMGMTPGEHVRDLAEAERERLETIASVCRGLADMAAGRGITLEEWRDELTREYGIQW